MTALLVFRWAQLACLCQGLTPRGGPLRARLHCFVGNACLRGGVSQGLVMGGVPPTHLSAECGGWALWSIPKLWEGSRAPGSQRVVCSVGQTLPCWRATQNALATV